MVGWTIGQENPRSLERHPSHEIGCFVGPQYDRLDADAKESQTASKAIEAEFKIAPALLVRTKRGEHHYYRRAANTYANLEGYGTDEYPEKIDIRTGRSLIVLPPSTGENRLPSGGDHGGEELTVIGEDVIDAVYQHNGTRLSRPDDTRVLGGDKGPVSSSQVRNTTGTTRTSGCRPRVRRVDEGTHCYLQRDAW